MHETHLIQPIISGISKQALKEGAKTVTSIRLRIGELTGIKEDSFRETFAILSKNTILEKAKLEIFLFPGSRIDVISFDIE